jgi:type VI protein secretion system component VasK
MIEFLKHCFPKQITKDQSRDTGMAMALLALLLGFLTDARWFFPLATVLLVVTMAVPSVYRPIAFVWLGLSHFLGTIVSRILLTAVFFVVVLPVGLLRRAMGMDSLQLKKFGRGKESVMRVRDHVYVPSDIDKPY